jgi:diacylglycerol diphosphate phosphatase / phosphatidate phosphatase
MFSLDDRSKSYPFALVQRVPVRMNLIYAGLVPGVIILTWAAALRLGVHQTHVSILGLFISHALASFLTDIVKDAVGRPRPDLIARCKPAKGTPGHSLVTIDVCTETDHHILNDGWRSFPSGHSSFAFAGLGYLAL